MVSEVWWQSVFSLGAILGGVGSGKPSRDLPSRDLPSRDLPSRDLPCWTTLWLSLRGLAVIPEAFTSWFGD